MTDMAVNQDDETPSGPRASVKPAVGDVITERRRPQEGKGRAISVIIEVGSVQVIVRSDKDGRTRPLRRDQLQRYVKIGRRVVKPDGGPQAG